VGHKASVIGLGGMGQTMLARMAKHPGFDVVCAWDPNAAAMETTSDRYPGIQLAGSPEEALGHPETTVVYIASPPATHSGLATVALESQKAVYCEKPLGVNVEDSQELVERALNSGCTNIVNFSMASTAATQAAEKWLRDGVAGDVSGVEIRIHFSQWPRKWQMGASGWLAGRTQGGFGREVVSHWIYLTERLFGRAEFDEAWVRYPGGDAAETHLHANLHVGTVPVSIAGGVGGVGPDLVEYTIWGSKTSARISDWHRFSVSDGGDWETDTATVTNPGNVNNGLLLANAAAAVAGEPNSMPDFSDGLSVQVLVEQILN